MVDVPTGQRRDLPAATEPLAFRRSGGGRRRERAEERGGALWEKRQPSKRSFRRLPGAPREYLAQGRERL